MWVRSQDKNYLLLSNGIFVFGNEVVTEEVVLGMYQNKTRAMEVLDDIEIHINLGRKNVFQMPEK